MEPESFDFVIVGGVIAGLVLPARLSEDASTQVPVIQAGEDRTTDPRVNIPTMCPALLGTSADWNFKTVPLEGLGLYHREGPEPRVHFNFLSPKKTMSGLRSFAGNAYLEPARARSNLTIWTQTVAERVGSLCTAPSHLPPRGSVHVRSPSPSSPGLAINPRYLTEPLGVEVFARRLQFVETITMTDPLASQLRLDGKRSPDAPPAGAFADLNVVEDYIRNTAVGAHRFTSTCAMMPREIGGVVDAQLRVYGVPEPARV
ncbi:hypothetical protein DL764_001741 [Monosporascus ibericus]|uniref:Glucose-methanol-choline oxidoreductase C-terminal domain-containing protein n=1 Tax=Monosporascus ibericus TaxID=155417 RepID=A0A4Q4TNB8_9PEZI|nr:hypothetical protein DL764_001741 [Monosporascus ibericus]